MMSIISSNYQLDIDGTPELNAKDSSHFQVLIVILDWATEIGFVNFHEDNSIIFPYQKVQREGQL